MFRSLWFSKLKLPGRPAFTKRLRSWPSGYLVRSACHPRPVNGYCAKQAWERGKRCNDYSSETFRGNPVGKQAHPVEPGQRPEASLAPRPGNGRDEA
jgi:hypothetical protein